MTGIDASQAGNTRRDTRFRVGLLRDFGFALRCAVSAFFRLLELTIQGHSLLSSPEITAWREVYPAAVSMTVQWRCGSPQDGVAIRDTQCLASEGRAPQEDKDTVRGKKFCAEISLGRWRLTPYVAALGLLASCSSMSSRPSSGSIEAAKMPWGPFSRQCMTTRISYFVSRPRLSPNDATKSHTRYVGFSAMPVDRGSAAITASIGPGDPSSAPIIVRLVRRAGGEAKAAAPGDAGLLAQGSDDPDAAESLARQIGLSRSQMI
jgi:hypothetical protein